MEIKKINLRSNNKFRSKQILSELEEKLIKSGFIVTNEQPDLEIAIGGDGAFLRMVRDNLFNPKTIYTGINTGTLGFLQEISPFQLNEFIDALIHQKYQIEVLDILQTKIHSNNQIDTLYSLNEILIRNSALKTTKLEIKIDGVFLEKFAGDGVLISSSIGSTAYNMSFGGAIIDNAFATMQLTPIAPITSRSYHTLLNSFVFPDKKKIEIVPQKRNVLLTSDGDNHNFNDVNLIEITTKPKSIKLLKLNKVPYVSKINQKFLK